MSRAELEARLAKIRDTFMDLDDWLMTIAVDFPNDHEAKKSCQKAHSALAQLHKSWSSSLRKAGSK